jgi:hypothetical protein
MKIYGVTHSGCIDSDIFFTEEAEGVVWALKNADTTYEDESSNDFGEFTISCWQIGKEGPISEKTYEFSEVATSEGRCLRKCEKWEVTL